MTISYIRNYDFFVSISLFLRSLDSRGWQGGIFCKICTPHEKKRDINRSFNGIKIKDLWVNNIRCNHGWRNKDEYWAWQGWILCPFCVFLAPYPHEELKTFMGIYSANFTYSCTGSKIPKCKLFQQNSRTTVPKSLWEQQKGKQRAAYFSLIMPPE